MAALEMCLRVMSTTFLRFKDRNRSYYTRVVLNGG